MPDFHYEVSLVNTFDAKDHTDAVRQMIEWLENSDFWSLSYRSHREHQDSDWEYIDASDLDPYYSGDDDDPDAISEEELRVLRATDFMDPAATHAALWDLGFRDWDHDRIVAWRRDNG